MILKQGENISLSDRKNYIVSFSTIIDERNYVCLIDKNDYTNIMFCEFQNNELIEISDDELIKKLVLIFKNNFNQELK